MDNSPEQIGLLTVGILKLLTYLTFLTFYVIRINKLDKLASNSIQKDRSVKFRIIGICMLIALDSIHIILSYSDPYYYMAPYANFTLIEILGIFDLILQIYIITREHKKMTNRKSKSVLMLWIFIAAEQISTIVIVEYYAPNTGIILPIFKVIVSSVLVIMTFLMQPQVETNLIDVHSNIHEPRLPILSETGSIYQKDNQNIYVQFNKEFQVSVQKQCFQFSFKIAVYVCGKFHIITKSETQFLDFSHSMAGIFPNCETVCLKNPFKLKNSLNITKCGQEKQRTYQSYLIELTKTSEYYCELLMNFLQIGQNQRQILQKKKGLSLLKKQSLNNLDQQQKQQRPFFVVTYKQQKIHISNPQILQIYINKSNKQILQFHNKLQAQKKLKIQLLSEDPNINELLHFIQRISNSKYYWKYFAQWMCLGTLIQDKIFNMLDFWNQGFYALDIHVIGYQASFDRNNSVIYLYLISICCRNSGKQLVVKKRFNDFVKLDSNVRKFILSENLKNVHIPSLPPKFSPFQSKTSPNSRRVYFDNYLKDLIKIEGINHCIKLLQFLQLNNDMISNYSQMIKESDLTQSKNSQKDKSRSGSGSGPGSGPRSIHIPMPESKTRRNRMGSEIFENIKVDELGFDS